MGAIYGYCEQCGMELVSIDEYYAPPGICRPCWDAVMYEELRQQDLTEKIDNDENKEQ